MKTTIQQIWYITESGKTYTDTTDDFGTDWKEAHSSALFKILRAEKDGAKITVDKEDGINAEWTANYPNGYACHCILTTNEED